MESFCYMPEKVVRDIMLRLPVKSLLRFMCVCKSWCAEIRSPFFITQHLHIQSTSNNDNRLIMLNGIDDAHLLVFDDETHEHDAVVAKVDEILAPFDVEEGMDLEPRFVGACNGILCIICDIFLVDDQTTQMIVLWNPATKEMKVVPRPRIPLPSENPLPHFGFGFDAKTSDYKVVRIVNSLSPSYRDSLPPVVEVYSLSTNCWKEIDSQVPFCCFDMYNHTYLDGICYWTGYEKGYVLLSFDMADEEFQMTPLPICKIYNPELICISVLRGSIALIVDRNGYSYLSGVDIWLIGKNIKNNSWVKHLTVEIKPGVFVSQQLGFWRNDEILLVSELRLLSYDLKKRVFRNTHVDYGLPYVDKRCVRFVALAFKESLVPLKQD